MGICIFENNWNIVVKLLKVDILIIERLIVFYIKIIKYFNKEFKVKKLLDIEEK